MATGKAIKVQLALFCIIFITHLALTQCNDRTSFSSRKNVVDNLRVRDNHANTADGSKLDVCREKQCEGQPCWCCIFKCWETEADCNAHCFNPAPLLN